MSNTIKLSQIRRARTRAKNVVCKRIYSSRPRNKLGKLLHCILQFCSGRVALGGSRVLIHSFRMFPSQTLPWHNFTCADSYFRHASHSFSYFWGHIPVLCRLSPPLTCAEDTWWELFLSGWVEPLPGHWQLRFLGVCLSERGRARGLVRTEEEAQGKPNPAAPVSLLLGQV